MTEPSWHDNLWLVCRNKDEYLAGTDTENHELPDCSCGCYWFWELDGGLGADWGVCCNRQSPRAGLLTFEHMGCKFFQKNEE